MKLIASNLIVSRRLVLIDSEALNEMRFEALPESQRVDESVILLEITAPGNPQVYQCRLTRQEATDAIESLTRALVGCAAEMGETTK